MKKVVRNEAEFFTDEQKEMLKATLKGASDLDAERFFIVCERTGLDPFSRQIYGRMQPKKTRKPGAKKGDKDQFTWGSELVIITSIDGFRAIGERSGEYRGQTPPEWYYLNEDTGKPGWQDVCVISRDKQGNPLTKIDACRVGIKRAGFDAPVYGVANFDSFAVREKNEDDQWVLGMFWKKMPEHQIAKCAEAQGFRKTFPLLASGIYIEEEIKDDDDDSIAPGNGPATQKALEPGMRYVPEHDPARTAAPAPEQPAPTKVEKTEKAVRKLKETTEKLKESVEKLKETAAPLPPTPPPPAQTKDEDQSPFGEDEGPTGIPNEDLDESWKEHVIKGISTAKFLDHKLGEFEPSEIKNLKIGWVDKFADKIKGNAVKEADAVQITRAYTQLFADSTDKKS